MTNYHVWRKWIRDDSCWWRPSSFQPAMDQPLSSRYALGYGWCGSKALVLPKAGYGVRFRSDTLVADPNQNEALTWCCMIAGPALATLSQDCTSIWPPIHPLMMEYGEVLYLIPWLGSGSPFSLRFPCGQLLCLAEKNQQKTVTVSGFMLGGGYGSSSKTPPRRIGYLSECA